MVSTLLLPAIAVILQAQREPTDRSPYSPFTEIVRTAALPSRPGAGDSRVVREIWLTDERGMVAGERIPFLRLVDTGDGFRAQLFRWWDKHAGPTSGPTINCGEGTSWRVVCVESVPLPKQANWQDFGRRLLVLAECRPPGVQVSVTDQGHLFMEVFDQGAYRTYDCYGPLTQVPTAAHPLVVETEQLLRDLARALPIVR